MLTLVLHKRKNKPAGSTLVRRCCCAKAPRMCVVHLLRPLIESTPTGQRIFPGITAGGAVMALRQMLEAVGTERATFYRPHDLRRGHAEDLRLEGRPTYACCLRCVPCLTWLGAPLWKIPAAGEWRSPAFLEYLDVHKMEIEQVLQGCLDEESDCDEEGNAVAST